MSIETVSSLLGLLNNKNTTVTTGSNISAEGMNAIIQQILGGTQGLASVSSGQKSSGLYNSTTNQQLVNDLVTRASGELAKQQAGTTTKTVQQAPLGGELGKLIQGGMLLKSLTGSKVAKGIGNKTGLTADANAISEYITGASSVSPGALISANASSDPLGSLIASQGWSPGSVAGVTGGAGDLVGIGSSLLADGTVLGAADTAGLLTAANATADPLGAFIGSLGYDASAAGAGSAAATAIGADVAGTAATSAGLAEAGTALAGAGEAAGGAEVLAAILAWVICTELHAQGKLSSELYKASAERALTLPAKTMAGYHFWAIPFTRLLRKSERLSRLIAPIARSRCEYLLGKKRIWGWLTVVIGEPICYAIGSCVKNVKDWRVLYA